MIITFKQSDMKPILEHLRNLSAKQRKRVKTATEIAENIKRAAEAARKVAAEAKE